MKKFSLLFLLIIIASFAFLFSCEDSGSGDDEGTEATSLGDILTLSGTVDRTFTPPTVPWVESYTNAGEADFRLNDESDNTIYYTDDNAGADVDVDINYTGSDHLAHLYSAGIWPGVSSSNSAAQITTVVLDIEETNNDVTFGNYSTIPVEWYYYMYSDAETTLSGTFVDTDDTKHIFDNITIFEGWNRMIKRTSDGVNFLYTGGEISGAHWTCVDN